MKLLAIMIGKCASFALRLIHRGGSLPGKIALRLDAQLLSAFQYSGEIILVSGTNGKTSTSNMIADVFQAADYRVINNRKGDNLKEGITTTLLNASSLNGKLHGDIIVLEVDELNIPYVMKHLKVTTVVITNFFRDQLDRSQEMEQLIHKVEDALHDFRGVLVLNANDPNVVRIKDHAPDGEVIYFSAEPCSSSLAKTNEASEGKFCPHCNELLSYRFYQYSHIGEFHCTHCGFQTPKADNTAVDIDIQSGSFRCHDIPYRAPVPSLYAIYNCLAVISIARQYHIDPKICQRVFQTETPPAGRNETFLWQGNAYTLNLVKNPTGANEVLKTIELDKAEKALMIVLNDNAQDGTDVSWIYDAQFERVLNLSTHTIICSGKRAYDMALRIKYAGYSGKIDVIEDYHAGLQALYDLHMRSYVIATYTALAPVRAAMRKEG